MNTELVTILNTLLDIPNINPAKDNICGYIPCQDKGYTDCINCPLAELAHPSNENHLVTQIHTTMENLQNEIRNPATD